MATTSDSTRGGRAPLSNPHDLAGTDTAIGGYRIGDLVAKGGMGALYRATRDNGEGRYALKISSQPLREYREADRAAARLRAMGEAGALAALHHPNIVRVHSFGTWPTDDGYPYLVMDLVEGRTLDQWRAETRPSPTQIAVALARLANALLVVHRAGLVHRDLKGQNVVMRDNDGEPVLLDFGIAKGSLRAASLELTSRNVIIGTLEYLTPEYLQWAESPAYYRQEPFTWTPAVDLFAFGVMAYRLFTGVSPWRRSATAGLSAAIVHSTPTAPSMLRPGVPGALDNIIMRCLAKTPELRFPDAGELSRAFEEAAADGRGRPEWDAPLDIPAAEDEVRAITSPPAAAARSRAQVQMYAPMPPVGIDEGGERDLSAAATSLRGAADPFREDEFPLPAQSQPGMAVAAAGLGPRLADVVAAPPPEAAAVAPAADAARPEFAAPTSERLHLTGVRPPAERVEARPAERPAAQDYLSTAERIRRAAVAPAPRRTIGSVVLVLLLAPFAILALLALLRGGSTPARVAGPTGDLLASAEMDRRLEAQREDAARRAAAAPRAVDPLAPSKSAPAAASVLAPPAGAVAARGEAAAPALGTQAPALLAATGAPDVAGAGAPAGVPPRGVRAAGLGGGLAGAAPAGPARVQRPGEGAAKTSAKAEAEEAPFQRSHFRAAVATSRSSRLGVPLGAHVPLRLVSNLDSRTLNGAPVEARVIAPFLVEGVVVLPAGTELFGRGTADRNRFAVHFDRARLPDNREVEIDGVALDRSDGEAGLIASRSMSQAASGGPGLGEQLARSAANTALVAVPTGSVPGAIAQTAGSVGANYQPPQAQGGAEAAIMLDAPVVFVFMAVHSF